MERIVLIHWTLFMDVFAERRPNHLLSPIGQQLKSNHAGKVTCSVLTSKERSSPT